MNRLTFTAVAVLSFFSTKAQEIAITFDDAPTHDGPLLSGHERSQQIMDHLKKEHVDQVAFFVVSGNITAANKHRLEEYVRAGHLLANHSHSHLWIHEVGTESYIRDVQTADSVLKSYPGYMKWFRYPFLNEGRTVGSRDSIRSALNNLRLSNGYVTVDNYDWYLNSLLRQAKVANKNMNEGNLRKVYLDHIFNSIVFYDNIARKHLGRSPRHVLLLHENDLAALFLGDLIRHLRAKGWKIISPREAYLDPIAGHVPDILFNGQGRVAAIAREKGVAAKDLVQETEDEAALDAIVNEQRVFE